MVFLNDLLQSQLDTAIVVNGGLKKEVTHTILQAFGMVQNFLKICFSQSACGKNSFCIFARNNCKNMKSKTSLAEGCIQSNVDPNLCSKSFLCLPSYLSEETIGGWCTSCLKDALCVAVFSHLAESSCQSCISSSLKRKTLDAEKTLLFNCCVTKDNFSTVKSEKVTFSNSNDESTVLPPLVVNVDSKEDSSQLAHECANLTSISQSGECSPLHSSLPINSNEELPSTSMFQFCQQWCLACNPDLSTSSFFQHSSSMTSALVSANALMDFCWQQFNTGNWKDVGIHWRHLYTWSCVAQASLLLQCLMHDLHASGDQQLLDVAASVQRVVRLADMGLLMGAPLEGSPLASCASLLNPLARLSLCAEERGLLPEDKNLGQYGQDSGSKVQSECPMYVNQYCSKMETIPNLSVERGGLTNSGEPFLAPQSMDGSRVNFLDQKNNDDNIIVSEDLNLHSRSIKRAKIETRATVDSPEEQTQVDLLSDSSQSIFHDASELNICTTEHPLQSDDFASFLPMHKLHFEGLLKRKLCESHLPPITEFYMNNFLKQEPVKLLGLLDAWPAMKKWSPDYLRHVAGARTVPIEVGARYTDNDWSQELITLDRYVTRYMGSKSAGPPGYLAQHQLLDQIPELRDDIQVLDYCHLGLSEPRLNAWIGPRGTVSPLHHDPDHNILAQVVGYKYVRLYPATETPHLYPHEDALLSNTSRVDVEGDTTEFPEFGRAVFNDLILGPGDCVYIPPKCWHYVRSLSVSFSVSFWWS